ncbi:MAG: hypothetical protein ACOZQL_28030 [Myxococcota bacterium]
MSFSKGALIIPMNATFQTKCGQISAYGLVYRILQANGPGHRNASSPVTVYLVSDPAKASVNRCRPTNTARLTSSVSSNAVDPLWFTGPKQAGDGCDVHVENTGTQPVVQVVYGAPFPDSGDTYAAGPLKTTAAVAGTWPQYQALTTADLTTPNFTRASYGGAPFIIDAPDAQKVMDLLNSGDQGANAFPDVALNRFTTSCACTALSSSVTTTSGIEHSNGCHYVAMHQATTNFSAQVERRLNTPPAPFALYDPDYGKQDTYQNDNARQGGSPRYVLETYLKISGLWVRNDPKHNDSQGCALGNISNCTLNGTSGAGAGNEATNVRHGSIYDRITTEDLDHVSTVYPDGIINQLNGSYLRYSLFWAPHWEAENNSRGNDLNGMTAVKKFVNGGGNILGECASIYSWENGHVGIGGATSGTQFLFTNGIDYSHLGGNIYNASNADTGSNLVPWDSSFTMISNIEYRNCSDPSPPANCVAYLAPGNIFSQVGEWTFHRGLGSVEAMRPAALSTRRAWTQRMVTYRNDATSTDDFDIFLMGQQDAAHGVVVYVGGHDVSTDALGARVVLNSMLNLGGVPLSSERALAAPTVVYGRNDSSPPYVDQVVTPTFDAMSGYSTNPAVRNFDFSTPSNLAMWTWPYYPGHFRSHTMAGLLPGEQAFSSALVFDSSQLNNPTGLKPSPGKRNLVTWLAGYPKGNPAMAGGGKARNNVLQTGWAPETIDGTILDVGGVCPLDVSRCVDKMGFAPKVTSPTYDGLESGLRLVIGADGLCDVQQLLNLSKLNGGNDWGAGASDCAPNNIKRFVEDAPAAAWLLQRVRGYCYSGGNTVYRPNDSQCVDKNDNRAHLGGLVHSTAAVMEPSPNVTDQGARRPTVAFVAGYDGQLHAFYVGGGGGYTGPANVHFNEDNQATPKFETNFANDFASNSSLPSPGTELWSFLPASQLPWLETNAAQVDSSPVVMDVFADFAGSGVREWHTVLLLSLGGQSAEVLALDVTNPLRPRLLWDDTGSLHQVGSTPKYSPNVLMNDTRSTLPGTPLAPRYRMVTDPSVDSNFRQELVGYRKAYDFRDLGGTAGLSSSQIRVGLEPVYAVFAVSNMSTDPDRCTPTPCTSPTRGLVVHAIEASTGQLMWEWERPYDDTTAADPGNPVPVVASVISGADGASRLLIGDHEGRVWELNAATGENLNSSATGNCTLATPCQYPLFDTQSTPANPQPITTNLAVARVPSGLPVGATLKAYEGERVVLFGTAGADWISNPAAVAGRLHVLLYEPSRRVPVTTGAGNQLGGGPAWTLASAQAAGATAGVGQEVPDFPRVFAPGERVYGTITISGSVAVFSTAYDRITDVMAVAANIRGTTYAVDLQVAQAGSLTQAFSGTRAAYGGVAVYADPTGAVKGLVTSQSSSMNYVTSSTMGTTATNMGKKPALGVGENQGLAYRLLGWVRRWLK